MNKNYIMVPKKGKKADLITDTKKIIYVPLASRETPGIVQIGDGLIIDDNGVLTFDKSEVTILKIKNREKEYIPDADKIIHLDLTKEDVLLDRVDNTSDLEKPISRLTQEALNKKQNIHVGVDKYGKLLWVNSSGDIDFRQSPGTLRITQAGDLKLSDAQTLDFSSDFSLEVSDNTLKISIEDAQILQDAFKDVAFDSNTGVLTFIKNNQDTTDVQLPITQEDVDYWNTEVPQLVEDLHDTNSNLYDLAGIVSDIESKIPAQASSTNQLADKMFVNSTVQTATANFRGNWDNWDAVPSVDTAYPENYVGSKTPTVNDYLVVQDASDYRVTPDSPQTAGLEGTWRFKFTGTWASDGKDGWLPEYRVNEKPFTAAQLAAIDSGITAELTLQITANKNDIASILKKDESQDSSILQLQTDMTKLSNRTTNIETKNIQQDTLISGLTTSKANQTDLDVLKNRVIDVEDKNTKQDNAISAAQSTADSKYLKPETGIPLTDLSESVVLSIRKADTALQSESDPTVPAHVKSITAQNISDWNSTRPTYEVTSKTLDDIGGEGTIYTIDKVNIMPITPVIRVSDEIIFSTERATYWGTVTAVNETSVTARVNFTGATIEYLDKQILAGGADTIKYSPQTLTGEQQAQARTNIGAGTSNFDGQYSSLTGTPTLGSLASKNSITSKDITDDVLASKTYVDAKVSDIVNSAPETLDTLNELAEALGNDPNFATTIAGQIGDKASKTELNAVKTTAESKYTKPTDGIPKTDLETAVQNSLNKADASASNDDLQKVINNTTLITNSSGGFAAGENTNAYTGGAIGNGANASSGGAVGYGANALSGFAGGNGAKAGYGGAVGWGAITSAGFAGGYHAVTGSSSSPIDAIQLGQGTNSIEKSLQVYKDNIYNASTHKLGTALLNAIYPVDCIYISISPTSPSSLFGGTWTPLSAGNVLWTKAWTTSTTTKAGGTIPAGLPNITGEISAAAYETSPYTKAFKSNSTGNCTLATSGGSRVHYCDFDASRCSTIYSNDITTVQPPAIEVYMWQRTA